MKKSVINFPDDYVVVDIETTGFDSRCDEIIEIAAIKVINNEVVDKWQSLIKPNKEVSGLITKLTNITNEDLASAPALEERLNDFLGFIGSNVIVGHNVTFDVNFLFVNCTKICQNHLDNSLIDTLKISRTLFPDLSNHKLSTLSRYFNITVDQAHRALADCSTTNSCFQLMKREAERHPERFIEKESSYITDKYAAKKVSGIAPTNSNFDETHLFYNKTCVFTGSLNKMERTDAAQLVVNAGGICADNVTKKIDYLVLAGNDVFSNENGKSGKQKRAEELIIKGHNIKIISEDIFYDMIGYKVQDATSRNSYFNNDDEKLDMLKSWELTSKTSTQPKPLFYRNFGDRSLVSCDVLGYEQHPTIKILIIDFGNGEHKICLDYLKEMQPTAKEAENLLRG